MRYRRKRLRRSFRSRRFNSSFRRPSRRRFGRRSRNNLKPLRRRIGDRF